MQQHHPGNTYGSLTVDNDDDYVDMSKGFRDDAESTEVSLSHWKAPSGSRNCDDLVFEITFAEILLMSVDFNVL